MVFTHSPIRIPSEPAERVAWLRRLVALNTEESSSIEYKSGRSLNPENLKLKAVKEEMGKDASAMANAIGGVIIYGIEEQKIPREGMRERTQAIGFASVTNPSVSRDMLTEIFRDNMRPPPPYLEVAEIVSPADEEPAFRCFAIEIASSCLAHQSKENKFFVRRAATTDEMEHHEIVTVMNRRTWPSLEMDVEIIIDDNAVGLYIAVTNVGTVMCRHLWIQIIFPFVVREKVMGLYDDSRVFLTLYGDGMQKTLEQWAKTPTPPKMTRVIDVIYRCAAWHSPGPHSPPTDYPLQDVVLIKLFADESPVRDCLCNLNDIEGRKGFFRFPAE